MNEEILEVTETLAKGMVGDPLRDIVITYAGGTLTQIGRIGEDIFRVIRMKNLVRLRKGLAKFGEGRRIQRALSDKLLVNLLTAASAEDSHILQDAYAVLMLNAATSSDAEESYEIFVHMLGGITARHALALRDAYRAWSAAYAEAEEEHKRSCSLESFFYFVSVDKFFPEEGRDLAIANLERLGILKFFQDADGLLPAYYFTDIGLGFIRRCLPEE